MMTSPIGTSGLGSIGFWLHVHWLFVALAVLGTILFAIWAARHLSKDDLRSVSIWLVAIGVIGMLLTAPFWAASIQWFLQQKRGGGMMNESMMIQMMDMMMKHDAGEEDEEHEAMDEMMPEMMR